MVGNIQALRALAALMVVAVHAYAVESAYLPGRAWMTPFHVSGTYGVDLFFVISGVVMVVSTRGDAHEPHAPLRFLVRRALRIYPPYWLASLPALAVFLALPYAAGVHRSSPPDLVASFLTLPQAGPPLLVVGWTLVYEITFYLVFALGIALGRARIPFVLAVWLLAAALIGRFGDPANAWMRVLGSPFDWEFVFGAALGALALRGGLRFGGAALAVALVTIVAAFIVTAYRGGEYLAIAWWRPVAIGLPMALLVYAALALEARARVAPAWARALGDASYALYLWHVLVIGGIGLALHLIRLHGPLARIAIVAGGYALSIVVALAIYRFVERPWLRAARRYVPKSASSDGRSAVAHRT